VSDRSASISPPSPAPAKPRNPPPAPSCCWIGPIFSTLLRLSAPNVLNLLAFAGMITFDGFFLGRLGSDALAGASLAFPWVMLVLQTTNSGMGAGVSSAVARALGAGQRERADALVFHAFLLALALGAIFATLMLLGGPFLFRSMGGRDDMLAAALSYANVRWRRRLHLHAQSARQCGARHRQHGAAGGRPGRLRAGPHRPIAAADLRRRPIAGARCGGRGLGLGDSVCRRQRGAYLVPAVAACARPAGLRAATPRRELFADILKVGVPGLINTAITNLSVVVLTGVAGQLGRDAAIGYAMGARLEYILQPIAFGFGTAIVTMVGTNWGARQYRRARAIALTGATPSRPCAERSG